MGNAILDVVLGLVLVYLVLALLAMKVQELLDGSVLRGRVSNLHQMLFEACGQSQDLKDKVIKNPLIFALYRGTDAEKNLLTSSSGPSSIPPDLFARALLMALTGDGKAHPSERYSSPSRFYTAERKKSAAYENTWDSLNGLIVGQETSWSGFEAAIAKWFADIGDRADGWFKRRSQGWSLGVALALAALLNADSLNIATTLASDSDQRAALADIALRVDAQRQAGNSATPAAAANAIERPDVQVAARLTDAIGRLSDAAQRDKNIGAFNATELPKQLMVDITQACPAKLPTKGQTQQVAAVNTVAWLYILPVVRTKVELARTAVSPSEARTTYDDAFNCLAHLSSWLTMAASFSTDPSARGLAQDASVAIESAKSALLALRELRAAPLSIKRAFLSDPDTFRDCAESGGGSGTRSEFDACLQRTRNASIRLPLLFIGSTLRPQFCKVARTADCEGSACPVAPEPPSSWPCDEALPANAKLDLPALRLIPNDTSWMRWLRWLGGILFTTLFVALGAPFWFDLLGRVVKLRSAGTVRDAADDEKRGRGTLPPAPPAPSGASPALSPTGSAAAPGFSDARNPDEAQLTEKQIINVQQVLHVKETARLDAETRAAIKKYCIDHQRIPPTDELDRELYNAITGRGLAATPAIPARLQLGRSSSYVQPVAAKLMTALGFAGRISTATTTFTADLRALTVLYRYKADTRTFPNQEVVSIAAGAHPDALDSLDATAIDIINRLDSSKRFARMTAPWLDWALGELGQLESNKNSRDASNPRVCEYLDCVPNGGDNGDATPWCGAFTAWVITKHNTACVAAGTAEVAAPPKEPLASINWDAWGSGDRVPDVNGKPVHGKAALAGAQLGDIVRFSDEGNEKTGHHVAFFVKADGAHVWVLGGNQGTPGRVSLIAFKAVNVFKVRKP